MGNQQHKWRVAHLDANDTKSYSDFVTWFEQAYHANNEPDGMAMFSHNDSNGFQTALSITPQSVPYCPFSDSWDESETPPSFGFVGWVAGDSKMR